ncbi:MAG: amidase [Rhodobacteraceae bacterium]|nr:amidase [Paracoccaceae bacterium]
MPNSIPNSWMPNADMSRIHLHWTAGGHKANSTDIKSYHILVEADGKLVRGIHSIAANAPGASGPRASHTKNANTGAIGVSLCCMRQARERPFNPGPSPMTEPQWKQGLAVLAQLADRYDILVTPTTILSHAEVEPNLNIAQNNKWDIVRLAFDDRFQGPRGVGDQMRAQVATLTGGGAAPAGTGGDDEDFIPNDTKLPRFRVVDVSPSRLNFRRSPGGEKVGSLPERTVVERIGVFGEWWQVRTRLGFVGFVHSGFLRPV